MNCSGRYSSELVIIVSLISLVPHTPCTLYLQTYTDTVPMDAAKTEKLNNCIDSFAKELHCYLW